MRMRLKGINSITKKLADGSNRTYWYAWKGGPPLRGAPGTPEFVASYNEAAARKASGPKGTILSLLDGYQQSTDFVDLRERTKTDYKQKIKQIEERFGDFPLAALSDRRTRGIFMEWRDKLALKSRRQADYAWQVLALILQWGARPRDNHPQPVRPWWPFVPKRRAHREDLDRRARDGISQIGADTLASAVAARIVDRATRRRSAASSLDKL